MRNGRDRRSENPLCATRAKSACFCLGPISGSHQGQQPERLHSKAGYMAAPERFAETSAFLLHRGRRPYMAHSCLEALQRHVRSWRAAHRQHKGGGGGRKINFALKPLPEKPLFFRIRTPEIRQAIAQNGGTSKWDRVRFKDILGPRASISECDRRRWQRS